MPDGLKLGRTALICLIYCGLTFAAWHGFADRLASSANADNLERSLLTYAAARGLNAIISVAQGTEIAVQPVGVGVTITIGEALDPLNDLIERFSWVMLLAAASLGAQALLIDLGSTTAFNLLATASAAVLIAAAWRPEQPLLGKLRGLAVTLLFVRFAIVLVTLIGGWIDSSFLAERQARSLAVLEQTTAQVRELQEDNDTLAREPSFLERLGGIAGSANLRAQINDIQQRVEASISELISLAAAFLLQTVVLPLVLLWFSYLQVKRWLG